MERLWHLRFSSRKRLPLFPTEASQRRAVRALASVTRGRLAIFDLLYEHGHHVVFSEEDRLGLLRRTIRQVLQPIAAQPIDPVWNEAVEGRNHLRALLRYNLTQVEHHELPAHPALWSGSCFLELVGARSVPGLQLRLAEALPELRLSEVLTMVGLPARRILPASDEEVRALGMGRLVAATTAALALDPSLSGRSAEVVEARRLIVQVGRRLGLSWGEIGRALPISEASLFRAAREPFFDPGMERVIRIRLALEEAVNVAPADYQYLPRSQERRRY